MVQADKALLERARRAARERGVTFPQLVREALEHELATRTEPARALSADFDAGAFALLDLPTRWLPRSGELIERYRDLPLGLVDATVIAAAEMLGETKVATFDHRLDHPATRSRVHCAPPETGP